MTYRMRGSALAAVLLACSSAGASAATCLINPGKPQLATIAAFEADPAAALANFTKGGGALVSYVRGLVITNSDMAAKLLAIYASLNAEQKAALGAGLGIAAGVCTAQAPDAALDIQKAVVLLNDPTFTAAFAGVIGDVPLGALGSGGAASGSSSGGSSSGGGSVGSGSAGDGGTGAGGVTSGGGTKRSANNDVIVGGNGGGRNTTTVVIVPVTNTVTLVSPVTTVTTSRLQDPTGASNSPTLP